MSRFLVLLPTYLAFFSLSNLLPGWKAIVKCDDDWLQGADQVSAADYCYDCGDRRNHKDLYANPDDCHSYFQCFFVNETSVIGIKRNCPPGSFWRDGILQCVPEGVIPCKDRCGDDRETAQTGCYANLKSCSTYYRCSNSISYAMCCPPLTRFNASSCTCDGDPTCADPCLALPEPPEQLSTTSTTTERAVTNNGTYCQDEYGNILKSVPDRADVFLVVDPNGAGNEAPTYELNCAPGSEFDLAACRCDRLVESSVQGNEEVSGKQCTLYLPFDADFADHSVHRFETFPNGYATISQQHYARGRGALFVENGWLEIPGLKTIDLGQAASFCFFYRCNEGVDPKNPAKCTQYGGLLSNSRNSFADDFSVIIASAPDNAINANLKFRNEPSENDVVITGTPTGANVTDDAAFTQVCLVFDGSNVNLFIDNELVSTTTRTSQNSSRVNIGHCPYTVGTDHTFGFFEGFIDEVLVCPRALSPAEVNAHWEGRGSLFAAGLVPFPPSSSEVPNQAQLDEIWQQFKAEFGKSYATAEVEEESKQRFVRRYVAMVQHNTRYHKGGEEFHMKLYPAMDSAWSFLATARLGIAVGKARLLRDKRRSVKPSSDPKTLLGLPSRMDWREKGCVGPVYNQEICGACYAFATCGAIEGQYFVAKKKKLSSLSVQQLVECSKEFGNQGCDGGLMSTSYEYYMAKKMFLNWDDYPYANDDQGQCRESVKVPISIASYVPLAQTETELLNAVATYGTIACAISVTESLLAYSGGIFYDATCTKSINHAVLIVGYGCGVKAGSSCLNAEYWLVKNTWGPEWGEAGYFRLKRNSPRTCGLEVLCSRIVFGN